MDKELRKIIKALREQGFEVEMNKKSHYEVRKAGRKVAVFASTPGDWRSYKNSLAAARRAGFVWSH